jgi:hypothetical protein
MSNSGFNSSDTPAGAVSAHALFGEPVYGQRPAGEQEGSMLAAASGPYLGRGNKCSAKEDTCEGMRVKDEVLCMGHLRSSKKVVKDGV